MELVGLKFAWNGDRYLLPRVLCVNLVHANDNFCQRWMTIIFVEFWQNI